MISVCCCGINSKYDIEMFIRALERHNNPEDFEVCVTVDNRVSDGTVDKLTELQIEFDNVVVDQWSNQDMVEHLRKMLTYYDDRGIFHEQIRKGLWDNWKKYEAGELFDPTRTFLWLSSGVLYNRAVNMSQGDTLVITPGDFLYLFALKDLDEYIHTHNRGGRFYASPNAIWARLTNQEPDWLLNHVTDVHSGIGYREGFRWDTIQLFRDYLRASSDLADYFIPDFKRNLLISLDSDQFMDQMRIYTEDAMQEPGVQTLPGFHGFHAMTRQTFDAIGGFTEEWYGRAFADDKMTFLGGATQPSGRVLPSRFAVAWCGQHEVLPGVGQGYQDGWQDQLKEQQGKWLDKHPVPPFGQPYYLHQDVIDNSRMMQMVNTAFRKDRPPVRFSS